MKFMILVCYAGPKTWHRIQDKTQKWSLCLKMHIAGLCKKRELTRLKQEIMKWIEKTNTNTLNIINLGPKIKYLDV